MCQCRSNADAIGRGVACRISGRGRGYAAGGLADGRLQLHNAVEERARAEVGDLPGLREVFAHRRARIICLQLHRFIDAARACDGLADLETAVEASTAEFEKLGADGHPVLEPFVADLEDRLDPAQRLRWIERRGDLRLAPLRPHFFRLCLCHRGLPFKLGPSSSNATAFPPKRGNENRHSSVFHGKHTRRQRDGNGDQQRNDDRPGLVCTWTFVSYVLWRFPPVSGGRAKTNKKMNAEGAVVTRRARRNSHPRRPPRNHCALCVPRSLTKGSLLDQVT